MHLVQIETAGNQRFIFATNKLRENVGASQLVWEVGESVEKAVEGLKLQWRLPTSGKAVLLVEDEARAREIVAQVTEEALRNAPGMQVVGAYVPFDPRAPAKDAAEVVKALIGRIGELRSRLPGPESRFLRLPVVAECSTSGLPASRILAEEDVPADEWGPRSSVSAGKRIVAKKYLARLKDKFENLSFMGGIDDLEDAVENLQWVAVVHADGNGVGQRIAQLAEDPGLADGMAYLQRYREFSKALERCAEEAFAGAVAPLATRRHKVALIPLVLGGDDVTVLCEGRDALELTRSFLENFASLAGKEAGLRGGTRSPPLTASAGVAFVKPHFPFYLAYDLAEELLRSAKKERRGVSALDLHVLTDSAATRLGDGALDDLRARRASGGPYALGNELGGLRELVDKANARSPADPNRAVLPRTLLHALRERLAIGTRAAEDYVRSVRADDPAALLDMIKDPGRFLDALDVIDLWKQGEAP